jgi:alpha-tubulin suppressor-like RCC1 family protein
MNATEVFRGFSRRRTEATLGRATSASAVLFSFSFVSVVFAVGCGSSAGAGSGSADAGSETASGGADATNDTGSDGADAGKDSGSGSADAGSEPAEAAPDGEAGPPACVPDDGADCSGKCGQLKGRCGTIISCAGCPTGETCGGAGTPNVCGQGSCVADCNGKACGASDGCGGVCQSGACGTGQRCVAGSCVCDATSCGSGCCGASGVCNPGTAIDACGTGGALCASCAVPSNGTATCSGACGIACAAGYTVCGGACCAATKATAIGAGFRHACAVTTAGGVLCWGDNTYGELGDGTTTNRDAPVPVTGLTAGIQAVALGEVFTCALTTAGGVLCWGNNAYGMLGNGSTTNSAVPTAVSGLASGVTAIAAGDQHACAVTGGGVECWGTNVSGELGNGTKTNSDVPVHVSGLSGVVMVAAGTAHSCAMGSGGVACWGDNTDGELGDGMANQTQSLVPVTINPAYLSNVSAIAANGYYSCAIAGTGGVACWGLGDGANVAWISPQGLDGVGPGVTQFSMGGAHSCYLIAGAASCIGENQEGELGNGSTTTSVETPVAVSGLGSGVAAVAAGGFHTCALTTDGRVQCWGRNLEGELGNGSTTDSLVPVTVSGF